MFGGKILAWYFVNMNISPVSLLTSFTQSLNRQKLWDLRCKILSWQVIEQKIPTSRLPDSGFLVFAKSEATLHFGRWMKCKMLHFYDKAEPLFENCVYKVLTIFDPFRKRTFAAVTLSKYICFENCFSSKERWWEGKIGLSPLVTGKLNYLEILCRIIRCTFFIFRFKEEVMLIKGVL